MEDNNSKIIRLAIELAHDRTFFESGDILRNEDEMYKDPDADELSYTDTIQSRFDNWYDVYFEQISKIFTELHVYTLEDLDGNDTLLPSNKEFNSKLFMEKSKENNRVYTLYEFVRDYNMSNSGEEVNHIIIR